MSRRILLGVITVMAVVGVVFGSIIFFILGIVRPFAVAIVWLMSFVVFFVKPDLFDKRYGNDDSNTKN